MPISRHRKKARPSRPGGRELAERISQNEILKRQAIRRKNNLCTHGDDIRVYADQASRDADKTAPAIVCEECGRPKLRYQLVSPETAKQLEDPEQRPFIMNRLREIWG
jgi:hypothetical protein